MGLAGPCPTPPQPLPGLIPAHVSQAGPMASAAAEEEKGSPIVVGLLVVGNIIILVRHPPVLGAGGRWGEGGSPEPRGGG